MKRELQRIEQLKKRFGQRIIFHDTADYPHPETFHAKLTANQIKWDPESVSAWAYGEHIEDGDELCVGAWGKISKDYLGVKDYKFKYPIPNLSLSVEKSKKITQELNALGWQKALLNVPFLRDTVQWN